MYKLIPRIFVIFMLIRIREAFVIACNDINTNICNVADTEGAAERDEPVEIVGHDWVFLLHGVNSFYAISRGTFKQIPANLFDQMPNLENFYAVDVEMEALPSNSFRSCIKLQKIGLQRNEIKEIGAEFASACPQVFNIDLSNNKISALSADMFKGLISLSVLNLDYNFIEVLSEGLFNELPSLTLLTLEMNNLQFIHPNAFTNLIELHSLVLSNNRLKVVKCEWFANKNYFERMNLEGNEIEAICPEMFDFWLDPKLNTTEIIFYLNLSRNLCANGEFRSVNKRTALNIKNRLNKCFYEYENNYYYKNFP